MNLWPFGRRLAAAAATVSAPAVPAANAADRRTSRPGSFTPTQPRQGATGLVGRDAELSRVLQALNEDHAHVVIYSERGRGKTSLANAAVERLRRSGTVIARFSCEAESRFGEIIQGLLASLPPGVLPPGGVNAVLPPDDVRPGDVVSMLAGLDCRAPVFVVDEFDRVADPSVATRIADTIKRLSDRGAGLLFVIVGVAENLEQILGQHPSIQRNIAAVQLPLLTDGEVSRLISSGMARAGVAIAPEMTARTVLLSRGSPHMAQLLGLRLLQAAGTRGGNTVSESDMGEALDLLLCEASPHDISLWDGLTANGRNDEMVAALRRLAAAEQDRWGRLEAEPLPDGGVTVGGRPIGTAAWSRIAAAGMLRAVPEGSGLFVFRHRSAMHYILMLATRTLSQPPAASPGRSVRLVAAI